MPSWVPYASLAMGLFAAVAGHILWEAFGTRFKRITRTHTRYAEELRELGFRLAENKMEAAALESRFAELIDEMPVDFTPALHEAVRLPDLVQRAITAQAIKLGLDKALPDLQAVPVRTRPPPAPVEELPPSLPPPASGERPSTTTAAKTIPSMGWDAQGRYGPTTIKPTNGSL